MRNMMLVIVLVVSCPLWAADEATDRARKMDDVRFRAELADESNKVMEAETKRLEQRVKQAELREKLRDVTIEPRLFAVEAVGKQAVAIVQLGSRLVRFKSGDTRYGYTVTQRHDGRWTIRSSGSTRVLKEVSL